LIVRVVEQRDLRQRHDAGQDVVEVVSDTSRQRAERLQLLRLAQLFLQLAALPFGFALIGDVYSKHQQARLGAQLDRFDPQHHLPQLAGFGAKRHLVPAQVPVLVQQLQDFLTLGRVGINAKLERGALHHFRETEAANTQERLVDVDELAVGPEIE
jgi:hypothetical protein